MTSLWDNNEIQFARLLCELSAVCDNLQLPAVALSMDLPLARVVELFERAHTVFERSKADS